jgi:hypothetical protein
METFLDLCNFKRDNLVPRLLINMAHIRHWEFFYRYTDVVQLQQMGFPYLIASQLMNGAEYVGATHTESATVDQEHNRQNVVDQQDNRLKAPGDTDHVFDPTTDRIGAEAQERPLPGAPNDEVNPTADGLGAEAQERPLFPEY